MKRYPASCLLFLTLISNGWAQSNVDMQAMMQAVEKMQTCMQKIDKTELQRLQEQSLAFEKRARELCTNGENQKVHDEAMAFASELMKDDTVQQLSECGKYMKEAIPSMMASIPDYTDRIEKLRENTCDAFLQPQH